MGVDRVREDVLLHVRLRVGVLGAAEKRQADHVLSGLVAVLAVVEQADAVIGLGHVHPPVRGHLEAGGVVAVVGVAGAVDVAEGDVVRRVSRDHGGVEADLEHLVRFLPVGRSQTD